MDDMIEIKDEPIPIDCDDETNYTFTFKNESVKQKVVINEFLIEENNVNEKTFYIEIADNQLKTESSTAYVESMLICLFKTKLISESSGVTIQ